MINLRPLISQKRLGIISGALNRQKGAFSGAGNCSKITNLRPLIFPIRLGMISGALKRQKGAFSGAGKRSLVHEILYACDY